MDKAQETLAERIITLHKQKDGLLNWTIFYQDEWQHYFKHIDDIDEADRQMSYIIGYLQDIGLINYLEDSKVITRLTDKGYRFTTFKRLRRNQYIEDFPKKKWWLLGIVVYVAGLFSGILSTKLWMTIWPNTNQSKQATPASGRNQQNIHHLVKPLDSLKNQK